ncbi:MAG: nickel-dependent hydrogenase large subunit [Thermincolia bacterium]
MARKINISPVTRINGLWQLEAMVDGGKVVDARSTGLFFRGIEKILEGRDPRDGAYITERICGICSTAHAVAAVLAVEDMINLEVPQGAVKLRNLLLGADLLQNHIRHFYLMVLPDFAPGPQQPPYTPCYQGVYRIPDKERKQLWENYFEQIDISRMTHEMVTVFSGKIPHQHGIVVGGVSVRPTSHRVQIFGSMLEEVSRFVTEKMVPDAEILARYYEDYYQIGIGYQRSIVFPTFPIPGHKGKWKFPAGLIDGGNKKELDVSKIKEHLRYSWYQQAAPSHPKQGESNPELNKKDAYSWVKAPRYDGKPYDTGPLSRMWAIGKYRKGFSTMDRIQARVLETKIIVDLMRQWYQELNPHEDIFQPYEIPKEGEGFGLTEAMRGALGHWIKVDNGRISHYQVVTPSAWNCSPKDDLGQRGPIEEALIGIPVEDENNPVEIGRVARSFDPCLACAVQLITPREGCK